MNLKNIMSQYGDIDEVEDEAVEYIIDQVDIDKDGQIDLMEFLQMMLDRYQYE